MPCPQAASSHSRLRIIKLLRRLEIEPPSQSCAPTVLRLYSGLLHSSIIYRQITNSSRLQRLALYAPLESYRQQIVIVFSRPDDH